MSDTTLEALVFLFINREVFDPDPTEKHQKRNDSLLNKLIIKNKKENNNVNFILNVLEQESS